MNDNVETLIQRLLDRDPSSYAEILDAYSDDILRLSFLLLGDGDEARDILQESLFRLIRTIEAGRFRNTNGSIKGFLTTVARNLCLDRMKKRNLFEPFDEQQENVPISMIERGNPVQNAHEMQFEEAFDVALSQLTNTQRTILILHELNNETSPNIAQILGFTVENVRMHLCRARKILREILKPFAEE